MWPYPKGNADLITFTEEILKGKLYFCAVYREIVTVKTVTLYNKLYFIP